MTVRSLQVKEPLADILLLAVSAVAMNPLVLSPSIRTVSSSLTQCSTIGSLQSQRLSPWEDVCTQQGQRKGFQHVNELDFLAFGSERVTQVKLEAIPDNGTATGNLRDHPG